MNTLLYNEDLNSPFFFSQSGHVKLPFCSAINALREESCDSFGQDDRIKLGNANKSLQRTLRRQLFVQMPTNMNNKLQTRHQAQLRGTGKNKQMSSFWETLLALKSLSFFHGSGTFLFLPIVQHHMNSPALSGECYIWAPCGKRHRQRE